LNMNNIALKYHTAARPAPALFDTALVAYYLNLT